MGFRTGVYLVAAFQVWSRFSWPGRGGDGPCLAERRSSWVTASGPTAGGDGRGTEV